MIIEDKDIRLRKFIKEDVTNKFVAWLNDPRVVKYSNQRFLNHSRQSCLDYVDSFVGTENIYLAIEDTNSRMLHGSITAFRQDHHGTADIGIMVGNRLAWGRGIGYKAWILLMNYLIKQLKVRKVTGGTLRSNLAMVRIMEKSKMKLEAVRQEHELVDGVPEDILYFCKFSREF